MRSNIATEDFKKYIDVDFLELPVIAITASTFLCRGSSPKQGPGPAPLRMEDEDIMKSGAAEDGAPLASAVINKNSQQMACESNTAL